MAESPITQPYFHVGVLVNDLEAAQEELAVALGLDWGEPVERELGGWSLRVVYAKQGPPYLELIEGPAGSPWEAVDGPRLDHLGYWTDGLEVDSERERLARAGLPLEYDGTQAGGIFAYHRGRRSGVRVELLANSGRAAFHERWGLEDRG